MRKILFIQLLFFILLSPSLAGAVDLPTPVQLPLYKVELIIFAHLTPAALLSEQWPADPQLPNMQRVYNLQARMPAVATADNLTSSTNQIQAARYQILPATELGLQQVVTKLSSTNDYPILIHVAWLQPGLPIRNARRIHIYGGQAYTENGQALSDISPLNVSTDVTVLPDPDLTKQWQLNGYVRVSKPYLFELQAALVLTLPQQLIQKISSRAAGQLKTNQFVLRQTFRMRLGKLYYIDHPLFGILAEITQYSSNKATIR